jgi:hypothetical protein
MTRPENGDTVSTSRPSLVLKFDSAVSVEEAEAWVRAARDVALASPNLTADQALVLLRRFGASEVRACPVGRWSWHLTLTWPYLPPDPRLHAGVTVVGRRWARWKAERMLRAATARLPHG